MRQRLDALNDAFGVRPFDVRLAVADCLSRQGMHDQAVAAIEPFARDLAAGKRISRTDYLVPAIERVKTAAR